MIRAVHDRIVQFAAVAALLLAASSASAAPAGLPDFTDLVQEQSEAVVNISTVYRSGGAGRALPPGVDPDDLPEFFRYFFRGGPEGGRQRERRSLGSGFILSEDGYILTNNHVVDEADQIFVRLVDRREFEAEVIGTDPRSDLALLKVDATDLPAVSIGRSDDLEPGEWVLAIGSPFGFDYSVTAGIVSAKGRSLPDENNENYVPFIQTDVAINPGNSGGPLFDLEGRVVGINSQIYTRSGGFMGLSFAIPIDIAMEVVEQLKESGSVSRGWLGVMIQDVNRDLAESFGLAKPAGALVARVVDGSPAEDAGIQAGDIIVEFNGVEIDRSGDLPHVVGRIRAGTDVDAVIVREGSRQRLSVAVGELGAPGDRIAGSAAAPEEGNALGIVVAEVPPAARERFDIDGGVRIERIEDDSPAAGAGLRPGDVITRLNNRAVETVEDFRDAAADLPRGRSIPVLVIRGGVATFIPLRIPAED